MSDYKKLIVWQKAHALSLNAHRAATAMRGSDYTAFRSQIIRSAMSVPTNIVEDTLRDLILPTGLVDNKVCAIDEVWSGLRFVARRVP